MARSARGSRRDRRQRERELRKQVGREIREREQLAAVSTGGSPERPMPVSTAAVIEVRAAATACLHCGGTLDLVAHDAQVYQGQPVRRVQLLCRGCHAPRLLWFRIEMPLPS